jgi:bifunctional DNA-binding transcriptional regulator/antitoxin component of YhaV-PrlF toxin-antitoxin module
MAKVTSKLQVTLPKALARQYGIEPGDDIAWEAAGDVIRVIPSGAGPARGIDQRLRLFDQATRRQAARQKTTSRHRATARGWTRDDLYSRGRPR